MGVRVTLPVDGVTQGLAANLRARVPGAVREISQLLESEVLETFRTATDPDGRPWAQLSATTLKLRERGGLFGRGPGGRTQSLRAKPLQDRGQLRGGIVAQPTDRTARVAITGPASVYGPVQQFGNQANRLPNRSGGRRAPIPARRFLPLDENGRVKLPPVVLEDIREILVRRLLER